MITDTTGTPRKRPLGITIITILIILTAGSQLIVVVLAPVKLLPPYIKISLAPGGIIALIAFAVFNLVIAWGLWNLKRWAFWLVVIFQALALLFSVFTLYSISSIVGAILYANFLFPLWANPILSVVVLLYLFLNRNVRITFRETAPPPQPVPPMPEQ